METRGERGIDPVKVYLDDIGRHPLLTKEQEYELGVAIQDGLSAQAILASEEAQALDEQNRQQFEEMMIVGEQAHQRMVECNLRLVVSIAKRYRSTSEQYDLLERIQEGNKGLMHAANKFDPYRGWKFSTYATWWIRQSITRGETEFYDAARVPQHTLDDLSVLNKVRTSLLCAGENQNDVQRLSEMTGLTPERIREVRGISRSVMRALRLNQEVDNESGKPTELGTIIPDTVATEDYVDMENMLFSQEILESAKALLPERSSRILEMRYYKKMTLSEIGWEFGLTRERIRQIENEALSRLRHNPDFVRRFSDEVVS